MTRGIPATMAKKTITGENLGFSWTWIGVAVLAGVVNVAGYIEGQASVRRYMGGES